jgi:2-C-methyl-D-erythritol 4-phosphate cytidylyltransferase
MLYYSLAAFDSIDSLDSFVAAVPPSDQEKFRSLLKAWGFSHKVNLVDGGDTRAESVRNTLKAIRENPPDIVLIHDAARACVSIELIEDLIDISAGKFAAVPAHAAVDTLRMHDGDKITGELDRSNIACLETPQLFPYAKLLELHENASGGDEYTDDTTLFTRAGEDVKVLLHDDSNMKITRPEDISAAEGILYGRGWVDANEEED